MTSLFQHLAGRLTAVSSGALVLSALTVAISGIASAETARPADPAGLFRTIGSFDVMAGNGSGVAEIVDVSNDGRQLVYTDAEKGEIGFVDISNPAAPVGQGTLEVGGGPTSLVVMNALVLVGVSTSESFTEPSGELVIVNRNKREVVGRISLGGQPDSLALAPDQKRLAIVIENERDEDFNGGIIPQAPSGKVLIVELGGPIATWTPREVDLSALAASAYAGDDLEPEFVDINSDNKAVVSFQENNHLAVIDLVTAEVISQFPAGTADLESVDTNENDLLELDTDILNRRREPDAVSWIDNTLFASANEGDYEDEFGVEGGSRGFTIFNSSGDEVYESGSSFEHWLVSVGHYNEGRSENKGCEPEAVESGNFGGRKLLFVGSERCNAIAVYDVSAVAAAVDPVPLQVLATGIRAEGLKAIPGRNLLVASTESEEAGDGIPTMINLYLSVNGPALYPMIQSAIGSDGLPIPWVALSGLAADLEDPNVLYAVSDSFLANAFIYTIDVSTQPALITERLAVTGASQSLDLEGIAVGPDGHFWVGSEGASPGGRDNLVLKVNAKTGAVMTEIGLPADLIDERRSNGIEGIALAGTWNDEPRYVYVAIQRAWPAEGDTDKVNTKIGRYDMQDGSWGFVHYPLESEGQGGWIGLSEISRLRDGVFAVIERDKGWGDSTAPNAELKAIFAVNLASAEFRPYGQALATVDKTLVSNLVRRISASSVWTAEKLEGLAIAADGQAHIVTDNDGVDGATGETIFLRLGTLEGLANPQ